MGPKKILILYASAGEGHKKAALAIDSVFKNSKENVEVYTKDVLDYTSKRFKNYYAGGYLTVVRYFGQIWGFFYYLLDTPFFYKLIGPLRHLINKLAFKKLIEYINDLKPDYILSAHFMPNELMSNFKQKIKLDSCVTDYKTHHFWITPYVDRYFVASEVSKKDLIEKGVSENKIIVTGIAVDNMFSNPQDKIALRKKLGLKESTFTILAVGGGYGVGPLEKLVRELCLVKEYDFQLIVVCGKNKKLYDNLNSFTPEKNINLRVLGFVDYVSSLMFASDVMIAKSGGLIMSEALQAGLPCIILPAILGQETYNAQAFVEMGIAKQVKNVKECSTIVTEFLASPEKLDKIKKRMGDVRMPFPSEKIKAQIMKAISGGGNT